MENEGENEVSEVVVPEGSAFAGITVPQMDLPKKEVELSDFAKGVLNEIPEMDRPVVQKYINTWDGNVTKRFQSIHDEYKPYKELGDYEQVVHAMQVASLLNEDPIAFINIIKDALGEEMSDPDPVGQNRSVLPEFEGLPEEFVTKFRSMEERLGAIDTDYQNTKQALTEKEQFAQLDGLMANMHTRHGDFDERYVLMEMASGLEPEDAIKAWQQTIDKYGSSPRKPPPNLVRNGGSIPASQVDLSKLSPTDRKRMLSQALDAANSE